MSEIMGKMNISLRNWIYSCIFFMWEELGVYECIENDLLLIEWIAGLIRCTQGGKNQLYTITKMSNKWWTIHNMNKWTMYTILFDDDTTLYIYFKTQINTNHINFELFS